jgi:hypothetical protein
MDESEDGGGSNDDSGDSDQDGEVMENDLDDDFEIGA